MTNNVIETIPRSSILICDVPSIAALIENVLLKSPYAICHHAASLPQVAAAKVLDKPVSLIIACQQLDKNLMMLLTTLLKQQPMPVVIFTAEYDAFLQQQAILAGVSAFVVDGLQSHRVLPVVSMPDAETAICLSETESQTADATTS